MSGFKTPEKGKAHAKCMVYGGPGVGKTDFMLTFPRQATIDTEGGTAFFAGRSDHGLQCTPELGWIVAEERSHKAILGLLEGIQSGEVACESIGLDSATSIYTVLSLALSEDGAKQLTPQDWGKLKARFKAVLDFMYDSLPKHICITAQEKPEYAREGEIVRGQPVKRNELVTIGYIPDCDKKAEYACDFVFRITVEGVGAEAVRWFECMKSRHPKFVKGTRYRDLSFASFADIVAGGAVRVGRTDSQAAHDDAAADTNRPTDVPYEADGEAAAPKEATLKQLAEEVGELLKLPIMGFTDDDRKAFIAGYNPKGEPKLVTTIGREKLVEMLAMLHDIREGKQADAADAAKALEEKGLVPAAEPEQPQLAAAPVAAATETARPEAVAPAADVPVAEPQSAPQAAETAVRPGSDAAKAKAAGEAAVEAARSALKTTAEVVEQATGQPAGTVKTEIDRTPDTSGPSTREQRTQIGILRREVAKLTGGQFDEDAYRALLLSLTGRKTILDATADEAERVVVELRRRKSGDPVPA